MIMPPRPLLTVIETPTFTSKAKRLLSDEEIAALTGLIAANPTAGDLIPGTGGVRKLRWALQGRGKRGGARVIYFFHNETNPAVLLSIYAKNEQSDISAADAATFRKIADLLVRTYKRT